MQNALICLGVFLVILLLITKPLGLWMAPMVQEKAPAGLLKADALLLKAFGLSNKGQVWHEYAYSLLFFNVAGFVALYLLQRFQIYLPFNPEGFLAVAADQAFNTAVSFVTNTNWQSYGGESTMSYFTQMSGMGVQNFLSAATGIAVAFALMRGFVKENSREIGNFWVDIVRITFWVLLPLSVIYALFLISQGVIQNFEAYRTIATLAGGEQTIALGPVASQEAIKLLGTNGGGFFNVNSAHPFENPTQLSNFSEAVAIFAIASALTYTFGKVAGDTRQGWVLWGAMSTIFALAYVVFAVSESLPLPHLDVAVSDSGMTNMEGKEVRFDLASTTLFSVVTTSASCGAVAAMHDSLTPLAGMMTMWLMQLGEVVFGGVGAGFYGVMVFVVLAVFIAGLMVGRTPEYLGKKISPVQMKLASLAMLVTPVIVLIGTAVTILNPQALLSLNNAQAHGFSEVLYAWSSAANNNGSAFAGLNANTVFFNVGLGWAMWLGRFVVIALILALAGSLAQQGRVATSAGSLPTSGLLFMGFLVGVILLVGALTYLPALALGPVIEHVSIFSLP